MTTKTKITKSVWIKKLELAVSRAEKYGNIKLNIIHDDGTNEGIWAVPATKADKEKYDKGEYGTSFFLYLTNHALIGGPTWGAKIRVKCAGVSSRPTITVKDLCDQMKTLVEIGKYPSKL